MRKQSVSFIFILLLVWGVITYFLFLDRPVGRDQDKIKLSNDINNLEKEFGELAHKNNDLLGHIRKKLQQEKTLESVLPINTQNVQSSINNFKNEIGENMIKQYVERGGQKNQSAQQQWEKTEITHTKNPVMDQLHKIASKKTLPDGSPIIAVLVFSCNRVTVQRCLDQLIHYRPNAEQFPIIVSQDCEHQPTTDVIKSYSDEVFLIQQPDQSDIEIPPKEKKFKGYFKIARHYGWALNTLFMTLGFNTTIIVEDDLDIAPDFYEYFLGTYPLLTQDPSLWCVSAWNDNGKAGLVDANAPELLYRTDFFPGLGWMLTRSLWSELAPKWPKSYWDDWIRKPEQRNNRACIRPELSRTRTFGKIGVSNGLFYEKYLKFIKLNEKSVPFTKMNLTYLLKDNYDPAFNYDVHQSKVISYSELKTGSMKSPGTVKIPYYTRQSYKTTAKMLGLMDDFKSGVPRTGYRGVVTFFYNGRRVHLAPGLKWDGYDITWS